MDDYLPAALITVLALNLILFLGQAAIIDIGTTYGDGDQTFYNPQGSLLCRFDANACTGDEHVLTDDDPAGQLPTSEPIESGDGSFFTDPFGSIKRFFTDTLGLGYLTDLLGAPKNFLAVIGVPEAFAWGVAALWYGFTLFLIIAFFWGR